MWLQTLPEVVRSMLTDYADTVEYSDDRLTQAIVIAALIVTSEIQFNNTYVVNVGQKTITPDPDDMGENNFIVLVALKTIAMLTFSEYRTASNKGITWKDGPSSIDARAMVEAKRALAEQCAKAYEDAKFAHSIGIGLVGEGIVGPYRFQDDDGYTHFR